MDVKKEFEALVEKHNNALEQVKNDVNDSQELSKKTSKELEGIQESIKSIKDKLENEEQKNAIAKMQEQLDNIDLKINKKGEQEEAADFRTQLKKALADHAEKLQSMGSNYDSKASVENSQFTFSVKGNPFDRTKVPGTMSITNNVTGELPQAYLVPGLNTVASRQVRLLDIVSSGSISSNLVKWAYQTNKDGTAGQTAEGSAKNQIDFDILLGSEDVVKTTAYIKVSDEMIDDIDFIESEINNELLRELLKAVESGVYDGDGLGANLHGIRDVATAFAAGDFAAAVDNANTVDVLTVAINQIMLAEQGMPTHVLMNPTDVTALKLEKITSTDKRYVERLMMVGSELSIDGVQIIPTTLVTSGEYLIGDFSRAFVLQRSGVNVEVGLDGNDFTNNLRTIRAEWRGVSFVKNNDRTAFVAGVLATDAAALETI